MTHLGASSQTWRTVMPDEGSAPHDAEHGGAGPAAEGDAGHGGVGAGDGDEDGRVVGPTHAAPAHRAPGVPVEQGADPEQQGDGDGIDGHDQPGRRGRGRRHQRRPRDQRDEEGHLVEDAAQRRLDRRPLAVAGPARGSTVTSWVRSGHRPPGGGRLDGTASGPAGPTAIASSTNRRRRRRPTASTWARPASVQDHPGGQVGPPRRGQGPVDLDMELSP